MGRDIFDDDYEEEDENRESEKATEFAGPEFDLDYTVLNGDHDISALADPNVRFGRGHRHKRKTMIHMQCPYIS